MSHLLRRALFAFLMAFALRAAAADAPRLQTLQIEIWPEYDRPQTLVILKGELAPDAKLPAAVALRIPVSAGAPSAVAYADASGNLLNLNYERQEAKLLATLRFTTPQRSFHVEFYEPLAASQAEREVRYEWPGDLAVERLSMLVKEPAGASGLSVSPELRITGTSPDGLKYRAGDFGPLKAGERQTLAARYTRADARPTAEILRAAAPRGDERRLWMIAIAVAAIVPVASVAVLWRRRRREAPAVTGIACPKCGRPAAPGDRFCAGCGKALKHG